MKIKRLKKLSVNNKCFTVKWNKTHSGAGFDYRKLEMEIGTGSDAEILENVSHELLEMVHVEMDTRLDRPDCDTDYYFIQDHRQFTTAVRMFTGLLNQFLG